MTVGELKKALENVPDDLVVLVDFNGNGAAIARSVSVETEYDERAVTITNMEY